MTQEHFIQCHTLIDECGTVYNNVTLITENNVLTEVRQGFAGNGNSKDITKYHDKTVLPKLTNAHCHLELSELEVRTNDNFFNWVKDLIQKKQSSDYNPTQAIKSGCKKMYDEGVGIIIDHMSFDTPIEAYTNLDCDVILIGEILGLNIERAQTLEDTFIKKFSETHLNHLISAHAPYSVHNHIFKELFQKHKKHSIHFLESAPEDIFFKTGTGGLKDFLEGFSLDSNVIQKNKEELLETHSEGLLIVHGNYLTESEIIKLKKNHDKICVVHCPASHAFFNHAAFPYDLYKKHDIPIALGTDSRASNPEFSFLNDVRLYQKLFKPDLKELMPMLTTNALTVLGIKNSPKITIGERLDVTHNDSIFLKQSHDPLF